MSIEMFSLFPYLIHEINIKTFKQIKDDLTKYAYQERKKDPVGVVVSNMGGWQSKQLPFKGDSILTSTIINEIVKYTVVNKIFKEGVKLKFRDMWININKKGDMNEKHVHPGCDLSGVLWIKTPKDSGTFEFDSPYLFSQFRVMECYSEEITDRHKLYPSYWIPSEEGKIVFFPASLSHKVNSSQSREDRISVAFNIDVNN